jgi:serine/threonine-protein kinase RsbW
MNSAKKPAGGASYGRRRISKALNLSPLQDTSEKIISECKTKLSWKLPAVLANVDQVCCAAVQAFSQYSVQQKDRFATELLLREALNNAVLHGCQENSLLSFSCSLTISEWGVIIEVSDEGTGFDWHKEPAVPPDDADDIFLNETGRGQLIYAIYANSIQYNDAGNGVSLTRTFNRGEKDD